MNLENKLSEILDEKVKVLSDLEKDNLFWDLCTIRRT